MNTNGRQHERGDTIPPHPGRYRINSISKSNILYVLENNLTRRRKEGKRHPGDRPERERKEEQESREE